MTEDQPQRKCLVTGEVLPKERLIRYVVGPNQEIFPDIEGKLPGRGLWLRASREITEKGCAKNIFAKGARQKVVVPEDLVDRVETLLAGRCLDLIGLGRRSGDVVAGFEKVRAWLKEQDRQKKETGVLFAASDGAQDGRKKIRALAPEISLVEIFSSAELGASIGRDTTVHLVLSSGGLAKRVLELVAKLKGFRQNDQDFNE